MKLFGTDGIRGKVGEFPITSVDMEKLGYAIAAIMFKNSVGRVYISNDGRASAHEIEDALNHGIIRQGSTTRSYALLSTPALSYFLNKSTPGKLIGIQITASHNPYQDNGIKVFDENGLKITEQQESEIENAFNHPDGESKNDIGHKEIEFDYAPDQYVGAVRNYLKNKIKNENNMKMLIMIDCANGATSNHVEKIFNEPDMDDNIIDVLSIHNQPSGKNINEKCGATHIDTLKEQIKLHNSGNHRKINLGVAFDGDGDRAIFVTANGDVVDGDEILYILSKFKKDYKNYEGPVIGTLMTNYGIQSAYKKAGIDFHATNVGDKFVYQKMTDISAEIGGESSGHIITTDFIDIPIGDGIITLIDLLEVLSKTELSLDDFKKATSKIVTPSKLINIPVKNKTEFMENKINQKIFIDLENRVTNLGRILIRESGTENLIRLLIEHQDSEEIEKLEKYFCDNIQKT